MAEQEHEQVGALSVPSFHPLRRVASILASADEKLARSGRLLLAIELAASAVIVLVTGSSFWQMLHAQATTSLWNDELYSVLKFSGRGPWTVVTDYHVANNHVFFNLLNSLTSFGDPFGPVRARFWSFAAMLSVLGLLLVHFGRRRRYLEGAMAFGLIAAQEGLTELTLQGRGYGCLVLAGVVLMLAIVRFIETNDNKELYWVAIASILGTWTVPTFIVFSGCTLLLLWACYRTAATFWCGVIVAIMVVLLHLPIYEQLAKEAATYAEQWGEGFAHFSSVVDTLSTYLWSEIPEWVVVMMMIVALVVPYHLPNTRAVFAARFFAVVVFGTFGLFLLQRTTQVRTACFLVMPLAFVLITIGSELVRGKLAFPWVLTTVAASALTVAFVMPQIKNFSYTPFEAWMETATYIEKHFPPGTSVCAPFRNQYLKVYLDDAYPVVDEFDLAAWRAGTQIYVDSNFRATHRFDAKEHSGKGVTVDIPQRRGKRQVIGFVPLNQ